MFMIEYEVLLAKLLSRDMERSNGIPMEIFRLGKERTTGCRVRRLSFKTILARSDDTSS